MAGGLVALLDDVAVIAKLAAASADDVAAAAGRAGVKAAGVVIDDAAVTPRYMVGLKPDRELPIIAKIARASLFNKLVILLPAALLLSAVAPWIITPILMLGGCYLAFEATEKIVEAATGHHAADELATIDDPKELEERQVAGAVRTDLILSAEIMAIALAELDADGLVARGVALALVAVAITVGVYGAVALIVKMDDVGMHLAARPSALARRIGRGLVAAMPVMLRWLSIIGIAAMAWVGGSILVHGMEEFGLHAVPDAVHAVGHAVEAAGPVVEWVATAFAYGVVGLVVGLLLVGLMKLTPWGH